jgi:hypothetical protein
VFAIAHVICYNTAYIIKVWILPDFYLFRFKQQEEKPDDRQER